MSSFTLLARETRYEAGLRIDESAKHVAPIPAEGLSVAIQVVVYVCCVICTIIVLSRVYARTLAVGNTLLQLGWDDIFALIGFVSTNYSEDASFRRE